MDPKRKKIVDQRGAEIVQGLKLFGELLVMDDDKMIDRLKEEHERSLPPERRRPPCDPRDEAAIVVEGELVDEEPPPRRWGAR